MSGLGSLRGPAAAEPVLQAGHAGAAATVDIAIARSLVAAARRIVVKVGTSVILRQDGRPALGRLHDLVESIVALYGNGHEILLVSSGAVRLGAEGVRLTRGGNGGEETLQISTVKRSCAAIGQSRLIRLYAEAFAWSGLTTAQLLVTDAQFSSPGHARVLRTTLEALLASGVIPILNENDAVHSGSEHGGSDAAGGTAPPGTAPVIRDNDMLAALVASGVDADLLVLLSDVDGLYTGNPARGAAALIPIVPMMTPDILAAADGGHPWGRGGMAGKLEAARCAVEMGTPVVIANGHTSNVLERLCAGEALGTLFTPCTPVHTHCPGALQT